MSPAKCIIILMLITIFYMYIYLINNKAIMTIKEKYILVHNKDVNKENIELTWWQRYPIYEEVWN